MWVLATSMVFTLAAYGCNEDPVVPSGEDFAILFIGNSLTYSNDLPGMLGRLFELAGVEGVVIGEEALPSFGLPDHWVRSSTRERLAEGEWDVVVLQQGPSATEGRPYLLEFTALFAEEIRAAGATPAMYMVWPAEERFFDFDGVLDSYRTAAEENDALFFPSGEAWRVAWEREPALELYGLDRFHPSEMGTYLAALVMFEQLSGRDPTTLLSIIPAESGIVPLDPELALLLQESAVTANARHARSVAGFSPLGSLR